ncbi:MAG TPA: sugar phosphate isomerase/epimerase family protein [Vicinamibacteria bacterium]
MKLATSNIAWPPEADLLAADLMKEYGFRGVELAPTRIWERPLETTEREAREHRKFWNDRGIEVVALQALLFGRPDLVLFGTEKARLATLEVLRGMMRLGEWLGARVLVFGAPKNRRLSGSTATEARKIAVDLFRSAGKSALDHGVVLAIEPNPAHYECDFVTTSGEGLALVREVASAGFGLHLDAAAMMLAGEDPEKAILACSGAISHFHASEPFLGAIGAGGVNHGALGTTLRRIEYPGWVSVEMRSAPGLDLERVLTYAAETYGG